MKDMAKNYIKEAQHAKRQALACEARADAFLKLWAKIMCPYKIGETISLPENLWKPHNESFRIFHGLFYENKNTKFLVKDIIYHYCDDEGVSDSIDENELSWELILSRKSENNELICKINQCHFNKEN